MRVGLLGPVRVDAAGVEPSIAGVRLRGLLARLAADAGRPVPVPVLAAALWAERDGGPADPTGALQSLASRLRRALGRADVLAGTPGGYRLGVAPDDVDALRFEREVAHGRRLLAAGDAPGARGALAGALALWRGPALADVADLPFAADLAARWERLRLAALEDRIEADLQLGAAGGPVGAQVEELQALTAEHPLRERLHGQLLRALAAADRGAEALAHYAAVRDLLAEELGTEPGPALQAIHARLLAGPPPPSPGPEPAPSPAPGPAPGPDARPERPVPLPPPAGLPLPLTSFVGRGDDVRRVTRLLADHRLVTLVGPGGAGKTRLAVEVGRLGAAHGPGSEVRLVALAPVGEGHDVPRAVLAALDGREVGLLGARGAADPPSGDAVQRLAERLAGRDVVLVLDNCEHVIAEAAALADALLQRCPDLRVLATSREPLHVLGERLHPVDPLPLPAPGATAEQALPVPAVRLLADRAAAVAPGFAVDAATVAPVVEICRRLDGLPLAIELAAARLRTTPVELVAQRLDDRFRLLAGGNRTALPRHQTLRAVVAWSWGLLDAAERRLMERLAVLPGGFDAGSAAALEEGGDPLDTADRLAALHDRSLLQAAGTSPGGLPRYRMLETIREYGLEQLADAGLVPDVRARMAGHFLAMAETAEPHLRTRDQLRWLDRLNAEHDNLLAAVRWAADAGDADTALRLCAALSWYWNLRGSFGEALTWLDVALDVPGEAPPATLALALVQHALCSMTAGRMPEPEDFARVEAAVAKVGTPHPPLLIMALPALAILSGDLDRGMAMLSDVPPGEDPWTDSALLLMEGVFAQNAGEVDRALAALPKALAGFRELGERWGMATSLSALGELLPLIGDVAGGLASHEEAARHSRELGAWEDAAHLDMRMLALQLRHVDHLDPARQQELTADLRARLEGLLDDELAQGRATFLRAGAEMALAELDERAGDVDAARERARRTLALLRAEPGIPPQAPAMVLAELAELELRGGGDVPQARELLRDPTVLAVLGWDMPVAARVLVAAASVTAAAGDAARAALLLGAAAAVRGHEDLTDTRRARLEERLRTALGDAGFAREYARGTATPRPQALDLLTGTIWPDGVPAPVRPGLPPRGEDQARRR